MAEPKVMSSVRERMILPPLTKAVAVAPRVPAVLVAVWFSLGST